LSAKRVDARDAAATDTAGAAQPTFVLTRNRTPQDNLAISPRSSKQPLSERRQARSTLR